MKRTLLGVILALVVMAGAYGIAWGVGGGSGPHLDYRPGYTSSCTTNPACHTVTKGAFLPESLDQSHIRDYSNYCLTCHNRAGEGHEKPAGAPSTNAYVNGTGFDQSGGYKGVSHSWKGSNGNAGTRTPTDANFIGATYGGTDGTTYMYNGATVVCETCHMDSLKSRAQNIDWVEATDQGDQIHYAILGYPSTKEYLSQYIKVYRNSGSLTKPTNSRTRKGYLVSPSEYTYDPSAGTITFGSSQGTNYIYVDVQQPYLRVDNTANAACLDCHNNRTDDQVSHAPGTGAKDQHPVVVDYGYAFGLQSTVKGTAGANIYLEGGQVLCTTCHDPHNAASNDGQALRNADGSALCGDCHKTKLDGYSTAGSVNSHNGSKHSSPTVCLDCHTTHGSNNILLLRNVINGVRVNFQSFTGTSAGFADGAGTGVCQVCHSATSYYKSDGSGTGHNTGKNCLACHGHNIGFKPGVGCSDCHGYPPPAAPSGWASAAGDEHASHMANLADAPFFLTGDDACKRCHGNTIPRGDHDTNKDTAGMDTSTWGSGTFSDGGTIGKTDTLDDSCTDVSCHSGGGTRYWTAPTGCDGCHGFPPSTYAHSVQYASGINSHLVSAGDAVYSQVTAYGQSGWPCGKCHNNAAGMHQNTSTDVAPGGGYGACGGEFTINVNTSGSDVTCSDVVCHTANTTTPNWY